MRTNPLRVKAEPEVILRRWRAELTTLPHVNRKWHGFVSCSIRSFLLNQRIQSSSSKLRFNVVPFVARGTCCKCTSRDTLSYMCTIVDKLAHSRIRSIYRSGSARSRRVANSERIKYVFEGGSPSYCFKRITQHRMFRYLLRQTIIAAAVPPDRLFNTFAVFVAFRWPWCPFWRWRLRSSTAVGGTIRDTKMEASERQVRR